MPSLLRPLRGAVLGVMSTTVACGAIWGFEPGILGNPDGGLADATTHKDGPTVDAGLDAGGRRRDAVGDVHPPDVRPAGETGPRADAGADAAAETGPEAGAPCSCTAAVPAGWDGPYQVFEGPGGVMAPSCASSSYPKTIADGLGDPDAGPAQCTCACGKPDGGACEAPKVTLFNQAQCTAASTCATVGASTASCVNYDTACGGAHLTFTAVAPVNGSCTPAATHAVPDAGWARQVRICGMTSAIGRGSCDAGSVCVPPVGPPFDSALCIAAIAPEAQTCPAGPYSHQRVYYAGATDTRGCSACGCGPSTTTCTGGTVSGFSNPGCPAPAHDNLSVTSTCVGTGDKSARYNNDAVLGAGPCAATGGQPIGGFAPTSPTTLCCTE